MKNQTDILNAKRTEALIAYLKVLEKGEGIFGNDCKTKDDYKPECQGVVVSVNVDDKYRLDYWVLTPGEAREAKCDTSTFECFNFKLKRWYIDLAFSQNV